MPRVVSPEVAWKVARGALIRQSCNYMAPEADDHDHAECVRDDTAYAADRMLRLLAAVIGGDDDTILARLEDFREAIAPGDAA